MYAITYTYRNYRDPYPNPMVVKDHTSILVYGAITFEVQFIFDGYF